LDKKHKVSHNILDQKRDDKILNSKNLAAKLLSIHEKYSDREEFPNKFDFSFTPLHEAMNLIIDKIGHKLNQKITEIDHRYTSCEFFLKPETILNLFDIKMRIRKCTFPKTYFFKKEDTRTVKIKNFRVSYDKVDAKKWKSEIKNAQKAKRKDEKSFTIQHNSRRLKTVLTKRLKTKKEIYNRKLFKYHSKVEKEPQEHNILDEFLSDSDNEPSKVSESDEIHDPALDELTASFKNLDNAHKYSYETNHRVFTFITPDFNFWHRYISISDTNQKSVVDQLGELPKNFRWLLAACANVINQDEKDVYRQLMILELEFFKNQKPVELQEVQPRSVALQW
jgi:hypothetical protein